MKTRKVAMPPILRNSRISPESSCVPPRFPQKREQYPTSDSICWTRRDPRDLSTISAPGRTVLPLRPACSWEQREFVWRDWGRRQLSWLRLPQGCGTVFQLTPQVDGRWNEAILRSFVSDDGGPWSPIIQDASGNLYGTTEGGPITDSEVFELTRPRTAGSLAYSTAMSLGRPLIDNTGNLHGDIGPGRRNMRAP
jgi:hypothetical protein